MKNNVVTRFAPSPTGFIHIGNVRTALFAYLLARKNGGTFILRIEDTDKEREVPGSIEHIKESLRWLGLEWDYGPDKQGPFGSCIQSERLDTYMPFVQKLIDQGNAYPDPYTEQEVEAFRQKAKEEGRPFLFRDHRPENHAIWKPGMPLRFKVPEIKRYHWIDAVRGELEAGEEALDDFILVKSDGYPTYNLAHILDDYSMGVTHIIRGDEFISSTPKFLSLYDALGFTPPIIASVPPILREDRTKKLGKRDGAKDILEYRTEGYLPETMINFLALTGWNPGTEKEFFTKAELIDAFDLTRVQRAGAVFNEEKMNWLNKQHLLALAPSKLSEYVLGYIPQKYKNDKVHDLIPLIVDRIEKGSDIETLLMTGEFDFFYETPMPDKTLLIGNTGESYENINKHISTIVNLLNELEPENFTHENIKNSIWEYASSTGRGKVLWPMRVALTGKEKSPDPFTVASIIGKDETIKRLSNV